MCVLTVRFSTIAKGVETAQMAVDRLRDKQNVVLNMQQNIKKSLKTRKSKLGMVAHVGIPALRRGQIMTSGQFGLYRA